MRLIDADKLLDGEHFILKCKSEFGITEIDVFRREVIDNAPTVERPTGHWVNGYKSFNCSVCGKIAYSWNHFGEYIQVKSNFCPHCGADMRKEAEKQDV